MHIQTESTFLMPLWEYDTEGRDTGNPVCPLGFITNQNRMAVPTWSYAMEKYPPARIVEIGAYNGGFTCALGVHAWNIGAAVHSFDVSKIPNWAYKPLADLLGIQWYRMDCFSVEGTAMITGLITQPGLTYLLCDGGNKVREFETFAPFLKPGDVIGAHDYFVEREDWWGRGEITQKQVSSVVLENNLELFMQDYFDVAAWLVYRRRAK